MSNRPGWLYPVQSSKFPGHQRWKAADGGANGKAKYLWQPSSADERPRYYFVNGLPDAIKADGGRLYVAGGEPDVLVYAAAGKSNALCWFGERSVPDTLAADLTALGVTEVVYAYDRDKTGAASMQLVSDALAGVPIAFRALALPGEMGSHYDINTLWIDCEFDRDEFWQRYGALEVVNAERNTDIDWEREYTEWCEDVERAAVKAWNIDPRRHSTKEGEWSKTHFSSPVRQDSDPSARWDYTRHGFKDFGDNKFYNTFEVADLLTFEFWDVRKRRLVAEAGNAPTLFDDLPQPPTDTTTPRQSLTEMARAQSNTVRIVTSDEAMAQVLGWMEGKFPPTEPIMSPYPAMHQLGGMAELWEPRKLIYVIGAAGMGKTSFMETGADALRRRGLTVIYWGPEWSPEEVQMKAIARYGGPSFVKQRKAHLWEMEALQNIPDSMRHGQPLSAEDQEKAYAIAYSILEWPGKAIYVDQANLSIEDTMQAVIDETMKARRSGQRVAAFFCDYLQKAKLPGSGGKWDELENKANVISYACIEANLVGVVASQVGKSDSRHARKNTRLDAGSAQGLSDQLCNLYVSLNPVFTKDGERIEKGVIGVEKNSSGNAPAQVTVHTALYRHYWSDKVTSVESSELGYEQHIERTFASATEGDA